MREYLKDSKFLSMLDEMRIKKHYAKLTILTFVDEKPLREVLVVLKMKMILLI